MYLRSYQALAGESTPYLDITYDILPGSKAFERGLIKPSLDRTIRKFVVKKLDVDLAELDSQLPHPSLKTLGLSAFCYEATESLHTSLADRTISVKWFTRVSVVVLQDIWMMLSRVGTVTLT